MNLPSVKETLNRKIATLGSAWHGVAVRVAFVGLLFAVMGYLSAERLFTVDNNPAGYALIALGFILLAAHNLSIVLAVFGLPHVTSYILVGVICGPFGFSLLGEPLVKELSIVNNLALSLIAFIAGGELRLRSLRERWRSVVAVTLLETLFVFVICTSVFWALTIYLPFTADRGFSFGLAVALAFGGYVIVNSPAVTVGVMNEYQPKGPVSQTVLGVVVVKDIVVILIFNLMLLIAKTLTDPGTPLQAGAFVGHFLREITLSALIGAAIGVVVSIYLKYIKTDLILFTIGIGLFCYQMGKVLHLDGILLCLAAGFFVENFTRQGDTFIKNIEHTLGVVFAVFFSVAGAKINLPALKTMWMVAVLMVLVRMVAIFLGARLGARIGGAPDRVRQFAWLGLVSQAGVALGLAVIIEETFPTWGGSLVTIILSMIAIHELIGPVAFRYALSRAKELDPQRLKEDEDLLIDWDKSMTPSEFNKQL